MALPTLEEFKSRGLALPRNHHLLAPPEGASEASDLSEHAHGQATRQGNAVLGEGLVDGGAGLVLPDAGSYLDTGVETRTQHARNTRAAVDTSLWVTGTGGFNGPTGITFTAEDVDGPPEVDDRAFRMAIASAPGNFRGYCERTFDAFADLGLAADTTYRLSTYARLVSGSPTTILLRAEGTAITAAANENLIAGGLDSEWRRFDVEITTDSTTGSLLHGLRHNESGSEDCVVEHTGWMIEETLGPYFPTPQQLADNRAAFSSTAHASESDIGPFARNCRKTHVLTVNRPDNTDELTLLGSSADTARLYAEAASDDVSLTLDGGANSVTWDDALLEGETTFLALDIRPDDSEVELFRNGSESLGVKTMPTQDAATGETLVYGGGS